MKRPFGNTDRDIDVNGNYFEYKVDEDTLRVSVADDNDYMLDDFFIGKDDLVEFPNAKFKMQGYGYALAFGVDMKKHVLQFESINNMVFEVIHNNELLLRTDAVKIRGVDKRDARIICNGITRLGKLVAVNCSLNIIVHNCVDFVMFFLEGDFIGVVPSGGTDYDTSQYSLIRKEIANAVLSGNVPPSYCKLLLGRMEDIR